MHARRTSIKALALATATVLAGCVTRAPDPQPAPSVELPAEWNTPIPQSTAASAWLNDLQDPALNALVEEALADNANLQTAAYRFAQSLAEAGLIRADEGVPVSAAEKGLAFDKFGYKVALVPPQVGVVAVSLEELVM